MTLTHVLILLSLFSAEGQEVTCEQCLTLQEGIFRTILHNISDLEKGAIAGTSKTQRIEIGQLIWHMCDSVSWKEQRYLEDMTRACRTFAREHVDVATRYWQEKTAEDYKEQAPVL